MYLLKLNEQRIDTEAKNSCYKEGGDKNLEYNGLGLICNLNR